MSWSLSRCRGILFLFCSQQNNNFLHPKESLSMSLSSNYTCTTYTCRVLSVSKKPNNQVPYLVQVKRIHMICIFVSIQGTYYRGEYSECLSNTWLTPTNLVRFLSEIPNKQEGRRKESQWIHSLHLPNPREKTVYKKCSPSSLSLAPPCQPHSHPQWRHPFPKGCPNPQTKSHLLLIPQFRLAQGQSCAWSLPPSISQASWDLHSNWQKLLCHQWSWESPGLPK